MKCPHLINWQTSACKAQGEMYYPSEFQLYEYCRKKSHKKCPFYIMRMKTDKTDYLVSTAYC